MVTGSTLFWLREQFLEEEISNLIPVLRNHPELFTVICHDKRESEIAPSGEYRILHMQWHVSELLCEKLRAEKIKFYRISDCSEKVIPSLARVMQVKKVITHGLGIPETNMLPILTDFRNRIVREVYYRMKMHSIPMEFELPS